MSDLRRLELGQLDELRRLLRDDGATRTDPVLGPSVLDVAEWAELTPAWVEPYQRLVDRALTDAADASEATSALVAARERLVITAAACPQIVGLDLELLGLRRAEWVDGNLWLELEPGPAAPSADDAGPRRSAMFRIVGAEPRMWEVHGLPGLRIEQTMRALVVRSPVVRSEGQLIRSSY